MRAASGLPSSASRRSRLLRALTAANSAATYSPVSRMSRTIIVHASSIHRNRTSVRPKGDDRINPRRAAPRDQSGDDRYRRQNTGNSQERQGIERFDLEKQISH